MSIDLFNIQKYSSTVQDPVRIVQPFPWIEHIPFAFFLTEILRPQILVELGVHTGNSYNAFCQTAKTLGNIKCYGVDTWRGEEHAGFYEDNVFEDLNNYQKESNYPSFSTLLRCTFDEALNQFADGSIGLLHIDGLHTYEAVKHDFETWLPKVKDGGVIIFHDTQVRHGDFGVWKLWAEISVNYPSYEFRHCNGLGVLLIGSNPEFKAFLDAINKEPFLQDLFPQLGKVVTAIPVNQENIARAKLIEDITSREAISRERATVAEAKNIELENQVKALEAKAESMRIKSRLKRLFFIK